ncbi:MAG: thioredoxin family protein [Bacteroidota bacterium]
MALTESNTMAVGTEAPAFSLPDTVSGNTLSLSDLRGANGTVVMFICNHCPFVVHINDELVKVANDYASKGISFIAISSNDIENYPQDAPDKMKELAAKVGYSFPYLFDETQDIAKAYDAACTPDIYLFDNNLKLAYHGRLDGARPGNDTPVSGNDLRNAIDHVLAGNEVPLPHMVSAGCNIKWKS